jgi:hypothetical protein
MRTVPSLGAAMLPAHRKKGGGGVVASCGRLVTRISPGTLVDPFFPAEHFDLLFCLIPRFECEGPDL